MIERQRHSTDKGAAAASSHCGPCRWPAVRTFGGGRSAASARERASQASAVPANVWHGAQDLAIYALGLIGVDYRFGGTSPERGLDCSGLVRYVFQQVTGVTLPRTSQEISRLGQKIPVAELMPGDLVFSIPGACSFPMSAFTSARVVLFTRRGRGREVEIVTLSKTIGKALRRRPPSGRRASRIDTQRPSRTHGTGATDAHRRTPAALRPAHRRSRKPCPDLSAAARGHRTAAGYSRAPRRRRSFSMLRNHRVAPTPALMRRSRCDD